MEVLSWGPLQSVIISPTAFAISAVPLGSGCLCHRHPNHGPVAERWWSASVALRRSARLLQAPRRCGIPVLDQWLSHRLEGALSLFGLLQGLVAGSMWGG